MGTLPSPLIALIWELAGGRPVHPTAKIMKVHITKTFSRLEDQPGFFEDTSWEEHVGGIGLHGIGCLAGFGSLGVH